jgi:hypothetical protein
MDPILCDCFSCRIRSTVDPILAATDQHSSLNCCRLALLAIPPPPYIVIAAKKIHNIEGRYIFYCTCFGQTILFDPSGLHDLLHLMDCFQSASLFFLPVFVYNVNNCQISPQYSVAWELLPQRHPKMVFCCLKSISYDGRELELPRLSPPSPCQIRPGYIPETSLFGFC